MWEDFYLRKNIYKLCFHNEDMKKSVGKKGIDAKTKKIIIVVVVVLVIILALIFFNSKVKEKDSDKDILDLLKGKISFEELMEKKQVDGGGELATVSVNAGEGAGECNCSGDLNNDGWLSPIDISIIINTLLPYKQDYYWANISEIGNECLDINNDGWLSSIDVSALVSKLLPYKSDYYWRVCEVEATCDDSSDGGINYAVKGNITEWGQTIPEFCINNTNVLKELFCNETTGVSDEINFDCSNEGKICEEGACVVGNVTIPPGGGINGTEGNMSSNSS